VLRALARTILQRIGRRWRAEKKKEDDAEKVDAGQVVRDAPIEKRGDDRFGRAAFADAIAQHILEGNVSEGAVVAVMGPWGSGKTSVLNMIREALSDRPGDVEVLDFNPWYFSGTQQLVEHFFGDIAARFTESKDPKLTKAATALKQYGRLVRPVGQLAAILGALGVPVVGAAGGVLGKSAEAAKGVADTLDNETRSIKALRSEVKKAFSSIGKRVVIVLDDLDRLRADEIRDIVRLVRLVADLPNTVYLLAFDRHRVEQALGEEFGTGDQDAGRNYLEKIVEVSFDLPAIRSDDLAQMLSTGLDGIVARTACRPLNKRDWANFFGLGMRGLFTTPRDVHRYLNALPVVLHLIGDEVALADVLALEAVRVLAPDYFTALPGAIELLTGTNRGEDAKEQERLRKQYDDLLDRAGKHREAIDGLNSHLFPTTRRFRRNVGFAGWQLEGWKRERRVAHPDVLRFYLERTLPSGVLPARVVTEIVAKLGDEAALVAALDALSPEQFENALDRLRSHEDEYPAGCVGVALRVLVDRVSRIRRHTVHFFDMPPIWRLWLVGKSLLSRIENLDERMDVVRGVFEKLSSLSAKWALLMTAGYRAEQDEHILVPKDELEALAEELRAQVIASTAAQLAEEREAALLLGWAVGDGEHPRAAELLADDKFLLSLLHTDLGQGHWFAEGEIAQNVMQSLPRWDDFERIFGADRWRARVRELIDRAPKDSPKEETRQLLELAARYLSGWRPKR